MDSKRRKMRRHGGRRALRQSGRSDRGDHREVATVLIEERAASVRRFVAQMPRPRTDEKLLAGDGARSFIGRRSRRLQDAGGLVLAYNPVVIPLMIEPCQRLEPAGGRRPRTWLRLRVLQVRRPSSSLWRRFRSRRALPEWFLELPPARQNSQTPVPCPKTRRSARASVSTTSSASSSRPPSAPPPPPV